MTTKLEAVVGYLAGRDADPSLLDELTNPSSEASRFLEATRTRSRALLEEPALPEKSIEPAPARNWLRRVGWASAAVLAVGLTFWLVETRTRRLEAVLERANSDARSRSERIEAALTRLAEANSSVVATLDSMLATIGHLQDDLGQLDGKVQKLANRPEPVSKPEPDPRRGPRPARHAPPEHSPRARKPALARSPSFRPRSTMSLDRSST